jgi:ankyrin repeat protein
MSRIDFHAIIETHNRDNIMRYINTGNDVNVLSDIFYDSPLFTLVTVLPTDNFNLVEIEHFFDILVNNGADVNITDIKNYNLVHMCVLMNKYTLLEKLLNIPAHLTTHINALTTVSIQRTPLHIAMTKCNLNIVELLLKHGADANIKNSEGLTALSLAYTDLQDYDFDETYSSNERKIDETRAVVNQLIPVTDNAGEIIVEIDQHFENQRRLRT